ncbi:MULTISPECIES: hypothetical protein [Priestia]|uniref:hypothetical protein n=1 Tax=Priestia TaxID=2800373 RepID=UPI0012FE86E6|nr:MULTISPECIES: hypothetical protein [Priestia]MBZ5478077.1 hypothetical protein [Bacillus sp. T_4]MCF6798299.1 hypothetical protein [Bacillus sp. ET1]MDP9577330.1 hypothetical protein [Bacillus sp. 1751]MBD8842963.1 hypothetical protein [Priestia megaterium]MCU7762117.1 hypothetical protein [Priestia megaterium]
MIKLLQSTARSTYIHEIYVHPTNKKIRTIHRSDLPSAKIILSQPSFLYLLNQYG